MGRFDSRKRLMRRAGVGNLLAREGTVNALTAQGRESPKVGLFFFGSASRHGGSNLYRLIVESAEFADRAGFSAIWTPERHFHDVGGRFPNPSLLGAALAMRTTRIGIRAGSVVLPLNDPLRVAEEWAVVDNLSNGRAGIAVASGWNPDDFVLAPDAFETRRQVMVEKLREVTALWQGDPISRLNGKGRRVPVGVYPRPIQERLPIWLTSSSRIETFRLAGELGCGVLTFLTFQRRTDLAAKIRAYRQSWATTGWPGRGHVVLMVYTFVHPDVGFIRSVTREPMLDFIIRNLDNPTAAQQAMRGAEQFAGQGRLEEDDLDFLADVAFDKMFSDTELFGSPADIVQRMRDFAQLGVDELACMIDYGVPDDTMLASLPYLAAAYEMAGGKAEDADLLHAGSSSP